MEVIWVNEPTLKEGIVVVAVTFIIIIFCLFYNYWVNRNNIPTSQFNELCRIEAEVFYGLSPNQASYCGESGWFSKQAECSCQHSGLYFKLQGDIDE